MSAVFFPLSKVIYFLITPSNFFIFAVLIGAVTGAFGSRLSIAFNVSRSDADRADVGFATGGDRRFRGRSAASRARSLRSSPAATLDSARPLRVVRQLWLES